MKLLLNFILTKNIRQKTINSVGGLTIGGKSFSTQSLKKIAYYLNKYKENIIVITCLRFYFCYIYSLRAIFCEESPWTFPILAALLELVHYLSLSELPHQSLYLLVGVNLMIYDQIGSFFSQVFKDDVILASIYLVVPFSNTPLRRFVGYKALLFGNTAMSSTGRASLLVGGTVLVGTLYNSYLDRQAANERAQLDRQATDLRAQQDRQATAEMETRKRAYQNYQDAKKSYDSSYFKKGDKPRWDENAYKSWSKT
jgi:hypothetical protein